MWRWQRLKCGSWGTQRKAFEQERSSTAKMYRQTVTAVQSDAGKLARRGEDGSTASTVEKEYDNGSLGVGPKN